MWSVFDLLPLLKKKKEKEILETVDRICEWDSYISYCHFRTSDYKPESVKMPETREREREKPPWLPPTRHHRLSSLFFCFFFTFLFHLLFLGWTFGRAQVSFISVCAAFACVRVCAFVLGHIQLFSPKQKSCPASSLPRYSSSFFLALLCVPCCAPRVPFLTLSFYTFYY